MSLELVGACVSVRLRDRRGHHVGPMLAGERGRVRLNHVLDCSCGTLELLLLKDLPARALQRPRHRLLVRLEIATDED